MSDIKTVIISEETKVMEWRCGFMVHLDVQTNLGVDFLGKCLIRTGDSKVINLMKEEDFVTFVDGVIDGTVMCSTFEVKIRLCKDAIDVFFPKTSRFGVSL